MVRLLIYSLVSDYLPTQINYYILDLSGGGLAPFANTPFCGVYLTESDESYIKQYLTLINNMKIERKKKIESIISNKKRIFINSEVLMKYSSRPHFYLMQQRKDYSDPLLVVL